MRNLLCSFLRTAPSSTRISKYPNFRIPAQPIPFPFPTPSRTSPSPYPSHLAVYSSKSSTSKSKPKSKSTKDSPARITADPLGTGGSTWSQDDLAASDDEDISSVRDPSYFQGNNVGPDGCPLFTSAASLSDLSRNDVPVYMDFRLEDLSQILGEGLVSGMKKEFKLTQRSALMVRQSFLELRDNFRRVVDPPLQADGKGPKLRKQIVLDGPVSCGKSIILAMLVHWARSEGWLVFYVPKATEWTHGGFFYKQPLTGLWDTPVQAAKILQDFLKCNESHLQQLCCQIYDPIILGEGTGVGWMKGVDSMALPEGSTLFDLIQTGITYTHAAVGVVVRLRQELSLVKNVPVLIAVDQYNSWFTFSGYEEPVTVRSCRPIHARKLSTVNAFRSMMHDDMMVGAFSHSTAVGKLRKDLPDVPLDARINLPRYTLDEAATVCHYYLRQGLIHRESFSEERWKKVYYLANGNGSEMRFLAPFI